MMRYIIHAGLCIILYITVKMNASVATSNWLFSEQHNYASLDVVVGYNIILVCTFMNA